MLDILTFQLKGECGFMALVKIKEKYQVTLPAAVREKAGLEVGDLLEAKVVGKTITLTPKTVLDRELAQALKEIDEGKTYGPFNSAKGLIRSLNRQARTLKKKTS
jgi:AbrB family looped-hinge helix DNA binding protein